MEPANRKCGRSKGKLERSEKERDRAWTSMDLVRQDRRRDETQQTGEHRRRDLLTEQHFSRKESIHQSSSSHISHNHEQV
nr:hypothetical protein CFP56_31673 [Quercus suber]